MTPVRNKPCILTLNKILSNHVSKMVQRLKEAFERHLPCESNGIFRHGEFMVFFRIICKKEDNPDIAGVRKHRFWVGFLYLFQPLVCLLDDVFPIAKIHRSSRTSLDAGRRHPLFDSVDTHGAFRHDAHSRIPARDIVGTGFSNGLKVGGLHAYLWIKNHCAGGCILGDGLGSRGFGRGQAGGFQAVSALVGEKIPFRVFPCLDFAESDQLEREKAQVRRVLMTSGLKSFGPRILIPLLAGDLASPAGRAFGRIDKKRFIRH